MEGYLAERVELCRNERKWAGMDSVSLTTGGDLPLQNTPSGALRLVPLGKGDKKKIGYFVPLYLRGTIGGDFVPAAVGNNQLRRFFTGPQRS